jgi:hypothetical protein
MKKQREYYFKKAKMLIALGFISVNFLTSSSSNAGVIYQNSTTWGDGCPNGSTTTTLAPDNKASSLLFDGNMVLEKASYNFGNTTVSKNCFIETTLHANYDEQFIIMTQDWRGYVALPSQSSATITTKIRLSHLENNISINDYINSKTESFTGPLNSDFTFSEGNPQSNTITQCGQSFKLSLQITSQLDNANTTKNAQVGIDSLDLAQHAESTVLKVPCVNPWKAEVVDSSQPEAVTVRVTSEIPNVNKIGALYVAAFFNNKWYFWSPHQSERWVESTRITTDFFPEIVVGNAPTQFDYRITDLFKEAHGAIIYVGVGYGNDATSRTKEMLNTLRYKPIYTVP